MGTTGNPRLGLSFLSNQGDPVELLLASYESGSNMHEQGCKHSLRSVPSKSWLVEAC